MVTKTLLDRVRSLLFRSYAIETLAFFRIAFGLLLVISLLRFMAYGWVKTLYIDPVWFFPYMGWEWLPRLMGNWMYLPFILATLAALGIALGYRFRWSSVIFFFCFLYIELLDKSNYLNHYYFVSLLAGILCFTPAHRSCSLDVKSGRIQAWTEIPSWPLLLLGGQMLLVYFFAGLAKINEDWLFHALPLRIWLAAKSDWPYMGFLFGQLWVAYAFSWVGMLFDLFIPFFLLQRKTVFYAYAAVMGFHLMTGWLFPIGMFPWIMMVGTLIFFPSNLHRNIIDWVEKVLKLQALKVPIQASCHWTRATKISVFIYALFQMMWPLRSHLFPKDLFWHGQGYRFSWRVMLMEKTGLAEFTVKDAESGRLEEVRNRMHLAPHQEKMMAIEPDMILQYAHYLKSYYDREGFKHPEVYCHSYVVLNGGKGQALVKPSLNLAEVHWHFWGNDWIEQYQK